MDLEKLEKMAKLVLEDLSGYKDGYSLPSIRQEEVRNLMIIAMKALPEHQTFFKGIFQKIGGFYPPAARSAIRHVLAILEIEKSSEEKIKGMKIFEGAEEKLKQVNLSFRKEDYTSTLNNLNATLELVLKDKLGIPTTITNINTSNIIEVLVKYKVEPYLYLNEAKKRIVMIDNKVKHQSYLPSKIDCINGLKVMEELIAKLKDKEIKLTEDIRNKIYQGL